MRHLFTVLFILFTSAAHATPPETISLHDKVIGISATQLFISCAFRARCRANFH